MKCRAFWWWLFALAVLCILCMNVFCIPGHDELFYAFKRMDATVDACPRIASLLDIVRQQAWDYQHYNARVFLHGIVSFFSAFRLYYLFDVLNTTMWFVLVLLVHKEAINRTVTIASYMIVFAFVFIFWWYAETVCMNAAFGVNYLWVAVATIAVMRIWRNITSWLWIPIGFLYGWSHEGFSVPMAASLASVILVRSIAQRKYWASAKQTIFVISIIVGAACIALSPAVQSRAEGSIGVNTVMLMSIVRTFAGCVISIWPFVLLVAVIVVAIRGCPKGWTFFNENLEWWFYFVFAFGLFIITCRNGLYRLAAPWSLAAIILLIKSLSIEDGRSAKTFVLCVVFYLVGGSLLQVLYGLENWSMLDRYRKSDTGVTYRHVIPPLWYDNMCSFGLYVCHLKLFQWDCGKDCPMSILPMKLYDALEHHEDDFFDCSRELPVKGIFVNDSFPGLVVKRGGLFSAADRAFLAEHEDLIPIERYPKYLPERVATMLATPMTYFETEGNECVLRGCKSNTIALMRCK